MDRVLGPYLRGGGAKAFNFQALSTDLLVRVEVHGCFEFPWISSSAVASVPCQLTCWVPMRATAFCCLVCSWYLHTSGFNGDSASTWTGVNPRFVLSLKRESSHPPCPAVCHPGDPLQRAALHVAAGPLRGHAGRWAGRSGSAAAARARLHMWVITRLEAAASLCTLLSSCLHIPSPCPSPP